jgi:hypothetical protein
MPLIAAWLGGFAVQAAVRSAVFETPLTAALLPMSGVAFILFTFYMISDPSTTPQGVRGQLAFGASVALVYGLLLSGHVVFTLFFALSLVCLGRGIGLAGLERVRVLAGHRGGRHARPAPAAAPAPIEPAAPALGRERVVS